MQAAIGAAQIVVSASFSLHSNALERSVHSFDTVLIDDAGMISEADVITSLRHGAERAILMSNPDLDTAMFLINQGQAPRALCARIQETRWIQLASVDSTNKP